MTVKQIFDLPIGPGQYTEQSERGAQGRWYIMDKVRFRKGLAEKIGGWSQIQPQFQGICRRLRDWSSLDRKRWAAIATEAKLYLYQDGTLFDITPIRRTVALSAAFTTFTGESRVRVTDVSHGAQLGDYVIFSGTVVGPASGLSFDGEYTVDTIIDTDNYEVTNAGTATTGSAGEGGPSIEAEYQISSGGSTVATASGYGTGPYGREGYGNARTGSTLIIGIRTWSLDTWGEDLLACPRGGGIYWWDRSKGSGTRAVLLGGDVPPSNEYMMISQRDRHVLALGAYDFFNDAFDPLLIRWCSTEDLNDWVPTSTNTSGDLRLYSGSRIVTGVRSRLENVVFTDVSVHTLPFVGGFSVFGLNIVGENVSILGPNAAVPIDARVVFMAESDFYIYDGIVKVLPCDVRNFVYDNLNVDQRDKVYGGLNREFNEIWWFYPSFDPLAYTQQPFDLRLPPGYELANATDIPDGLFDDVIFQADWEGANAATTYTEESGFTELGTFNGNAQLTTNPADVYRDTASVIFDGTASTSVTFPLGAAAKTAVDATGKYITLELAFRILVTPGPGDDYGVMRLGDSDFNLLKVDIERSSFGSTPTQIRAGFSNSGAIINIPNDSFAVGRWYFLIIEGDFTGGVGNGVERVWLTDGNDTTANLINTQIGLTAKNAASLFTDQFTFGQADTGSEIMNGTIDHVRLTVSDTPRYGTASSYEAPGDYPTSQIAGGPSDIGYLYSFNSGGFTEVTSTADNNYQHDYILTNNEPIDDPLNAEYAVELDVNPAIGVKAAFAGISFLRKDLTGTGETQADDAAMFAVELDYQTNAVQIVRWLSTGGPAAPGNLPGNVADFATLTGSAMVVGQRYVITVAVATPQITVYVDGVQAFQFDMDVDELAEFTGSEELSLALHMRANTGAVNDNTYRFYNISSGPVGVLTSSTFDISPIEVNRYVIYNYEERTWATGVMARTAWADRSPLFEKAYAAGIDGYLYQHETGTDDNGQAMPAFIQSFDMEIPNAGEQLMHVDQLIPDFLTLQGSVDIELSGLKYPQAGNRIVKGPYTVTAGTRKVSTRIRARQIAIRISSNDTGDKWRMATMRGRAGPHGKRG